jgi:hypothetical protein
MRKQNKIIQKSVSKSGPKMIGLIVSLIRLIVWGAFLVLVYGCGVSSINLNPEIVPPNQEAIIGHVRIFKGKKEVTSSSCIIVFTDTNNTAKSQLQLDKSGWVFTTLPVGQTYLSFMSCAVWNGLVYGTRELHFDVPGGNRTLYFGHIEFHLPDKDLETTLDIASAELTRQSALNSTNKTYVGVTHNLKSLTNLILIGDPGKEYITSEDNIDSARFEYSKRYLSKIDLAKSIAGPSQLSNEKSIR